MSPQEPSISKLLVELHTCIREERRAEDQLREAAEKRASAAQEFFRRAALQREKTGAQVLLVSTAEGLFAYDGKAVNQRSMPIT